MNLYPVTIIPSLSYDHLHRAAQPPAKPAAVQSGNSAVHPRVQSLPRRATHPAVLPASPPIPQAKPTLSPVRRNATPRAFAILGLHSCNPLRKRSRIYHLPSVCPTHFCPRSVCPAWRKDSSAKPADRRLPFTKAHPHPEDHRRFPTRKTDRGEAARPQAAESGASWTPVPGCASRSPW